MPEAGWYDDPEDGAQLRWWDGSAWTDRRQPRDVPPPPPPAPSPGPASSWSPAGGAEGTAWSAGATAVTGWPAPPRSFTESIQVCFRKYVDFTGRASRSEYWYFFLFTGLLGAVTDSFSTTLSNAAAIATALPSLAVGARRLHDIGRSGWNQLWFLLPIIGWIIIIVRLTRAGDPGPNAYG